MPIRFECPKCFYAADVRSALAGSTVKCPGCGTSVRVGSQSSVTPPVVRPQSAAAPGRKSRTKRKKSGDVPIVAIVVGGAVLVVVILLAFLAGRAGRRPAEVVQPAPSKPAAPITTAADEKAAPEVAPANPAPVSEPQSIRQPATVASKSPQPVPANPQPHVVQLTKSDKPGGTPFDAPAKSIGPNTSSSPDAPAAVEGTPPERPPILGTADLIQLVEPAVVRINALDEAGELEWHGSGFVVDPSGIVVTNAHVVAGAAQCVAVFEDGTKCPVKGFYSMQDKNDLAVIAIEPPKGRGFAALPIAPETPRKGETVFAFGCPHGLDFTASDGIVSSIRTHEEIEGMRGEPTQGAWLQTTAPISEGNSGGPLVNDRGEVVGVNSMVHRLGQNLNFAVAASEVRAELDGRSDALSKLSRSTAPDDRRHIEGVDLTGSPLGAEKLARIKKLTVLALTNSWSMRGHTINVFRNTAKFEFKRAGIEVVSLPDDDLPVLFVGVVYHGGFGRSGQMSVRALLVVPEQSEGGLPKVYTVWENEADLGSATRGESLSTNDLKKIKEFFRGFLADYEAAVQAHGDSVETTGKGP